MPATTIRLYLGSIYYYWKCALLNGYGDDDYAIFAVFRIFKPQIFVC